MGLTRCVWDASKEDEAANPGEGCEASATYMVHTKRGSLAWKVKGMRVFCVCQACSERPFFAGCRIELLLQPGLRVSNDPNWPVIQTLRRIVTEGRERIGRGLQVVEADWLTLSDGKRRASKKALEDTLAKTLVAADWLRGLPSTTVVICRKCKAVTLPIRDQTFFCCGALWGYHRAAALQQLPPGFWATHDIGDKFKGKLIQPEDILFGYGRDDDEF